MDVARKLLLMIFSACALAFASDGTDLNVASPFDVNRYLGQWHEIARLPMKHQEGCLKSTAEYTKDDKGGMMIKNSCTLEGGGSKTSTGLTRIPDPQMNAKFKVNFVPAWLRLFGIGWANYWVIEVDADYQYAVVSEPNKEFLWILSRHPHLNKSLFAAITDRIKAKGFDVTKLIITGDTP